MNSGMNMTRSHGDVDVAINRIARALMNGDSDWSDETRRRDAVAELVLALTALFDSEEEYSRHAAEMFGPSLPEAEELMAKRFELLAHARMLARATDGWERLADLREVFDEYTWLTWKLYRTYNGFLAPETGGV